MWYTHTHIENALNLYWFRKTTNAITNKIKNWDEANENGHHSKVSLWLQILNIVFSLHRNSRKGYFFSEKTCYWQKQSNGCRKYQNTKCPPAIHFSILISTGMRNCNRYCWTIGISFLILPCVCECVSDSANHDNNSGKLFIHSFRTLCPVVVSCVFSRFNSMETATLWQYKCMLASTSTTTMNTTATHQYNFVKTTKFTDTTNFNWKCSLI